MPGVMPGVMNVNFSRVNNTRNRDARHGSGGIRRYPSSRPRTPRRPRTHGGMMDTSYPLAARHFARAASRCADLVRPAAQPRLGRGLHHPRVSAMSLSQIVAHNDSTANAATRSKKCARSPRHSHRHSRVRTRRSSRCPTSARPSGTAPTPPGSSRPSCSRGAQPDYEPFDPAFGYLFNSYYETVGDRHPRAERGLLSRPGVNDIAAYRAYVDAAVLAAIDDMAPELLDLVELGLHHEQQHQELLLMDIKHVLWTNPLRPAYRSVPGRRRRRRATRRSGPSTTAASSRSGTTVPGPKDRLRVRQRVAAPPCVPPALRDRGPAGDLRRLARDSSPTVATSARISGSPTAGRPSRRKAGTRRCTGSRMATATTIGACSRSAVCKPVELVRARVSRQLLRGRRVRALVAVRDCRPRPSGSTPRRARRRKVDSSIWTGCTRARPPAPRPLLR